MTRDEGVNILDLFISIMCDASLLANASNVVILCSQNTRRLNLH